MIIVSHPFSSGMNNAKQRAITNKNSPIKSLFFSLTVVKYVSDRRNFNDTLHKHTSPLRTHVESENLYNSNNNEGVFFGTCSCRRLLLNVRYYSCFRHKAASVKIRLSNYYYLFAIKIHRIRQYTCHSTKQAGQQGSIQTTLIIAL